MTNNIFKLFIFIVNLPLYWLSYLVPKKNNLWVFGAWAGKKYADNSKYFFEYVIKNKPEIDAVWITKNKDVYNLLISKKYRVVYAYSIQGYYYTMRAKVAIISNTKLGDLNGFVINNNTFLVQLWHGSPMKKIGYDTSKEAYIKNKKLSLLFPYLTIRYNLFLAASEKVKKNLISAFKVESESFFIMGYPRNDQLFLLNTKSTLKGEKNIIYMPTYREHESEELILVNSYNWAIFNSFLINNNIFFYIKLHPQSKLYDYFRNLKLTNIKLLEIEDIYTVLNKFDLLITDYSSIYFDFLLLNKPVVLTPFDLDNYLSQIDMYIDYDKVEEYKAYSWQEVQSNIESILINNIDIYKENRQILKRNYNNNGIDNYSEKIFYKIIDDTNE